MQALQGLEKKQMPTYIIVIVVIFATFIVGSGFLFKKDKDHSHENLFLLGVSSHTSISDNTNGETSSEGRETATESRGQVLISISITVASGGH